MFGMVWEVDILTVVSTLNSPTSNQFLLNEDMLTFSQAGILSRSYCLWIYFIVLHVHVCCLTCCQLCDRVLWIIDKHYLTASLVHI